MYSCICQGVATRTTTQLNREKSDVNAHITEDILTKVNQPIVLLKGGEIYFATLPENEHFLDRCTGTGEGAAYRIDTTSGITMWANTHDGDTEDLTLTRMSLAIGAPTTAALQLNGPVILTGPSSKIEPLTQRQVSYLVTLARNFREIMEIVIVTDQ